MHRFILLISISKWQYSTLGIMGILLIYIKNGSTVRLELWVSLQLVLVPSQDLDFQRHMHWYVCVQ